jgi:hypothetical protein
MEESKMKSIVLAASIILLGCGHSKAQEQPKAEPPKQEQKQVPAIQFRPGETLKMVVPFKNDLLPLTKQRVDFNYVYRLYNMNGELLFVFIEKIEEEDGYSRLSN